jgi:hypothetical protein
MRRRHRHLQAIVDYEKIRESGDNKKGVFVYFGRRQCVVALFSTATEL